MYIISSNYFQTFIYCFGIEVPGIIVSGELRRYSHKYCTALYKSAR